MHEAKLILYRFY